MVAVNTIPDEEGSTSPTKQIVDTDVVTPTKSIDLMETAVGAQKWADFFRGRHGMKSRSAVEFGKRVEFCKGERIIKYVREKSEMSKTCPSLTEVEDILIVGQLLIKHGFLHRSERDPGNKKILKMSKSHVFARDGYYTWMYDGPQTIRYLMTCALVIITIAFCLFPVWPQPAKVGIWYLSCTFLIFITVFSFLRFLAFFVMWMLGYDCWFLPNIYDDDLGVYDSFKPTWSFVNTDEDEKLYRVIGIIAFFAFCGWVYQQPTEFDDYVRYTREFTEDMYSGKLLSDMSQNQRDQMDFLKIPSMEDLERDDDEEAAEENAAQDNRLVEEDEDEVAALNADELFEKLMNDDAEEDEMDDEEYGHDET